MNADVPLPSPEAVQPLAVAKPRWLRSRTAWLVRQLSQCAAVALVAFASYFLVSHFFVQSVQVVGVSMYPTLKNSEHYLLNRWIYYFRSPRPGDVVVIRDPVDKGFSVKRIIAWEGDRVVVQGGGVEVNGKSLPEPYLPKGTSTHPDGAATRQELACGPGQFVVMGDNRMNSADSRSYGPVPRQAILGMLIQ